MKKTNVILGIVIAIFVICAATILVVAIMQNKVEEKIPVNVNFETLSSNIEEVTNLDNTKMQNISKEQLQEEFNINPEWIKQVIGVKPYVNINSSMYVIVETTEENLTDVKMEKTDLGFQAEITLTDAATFNFCFKDANGNWDNNNNQNYTFAIEELPTSLILKEEKLMFKNLF